MGTSGLVFAGMGRAGEGGPFEAYLLFPFLIAAAVRFGPRGASGSMAAVSLVAIAGTAQGLGPFAREDLTGSLLALQMFLGVAAVTSLILAAVAAERDRAERVARMLTDTLERRVAERTSELSRANRELEAFGYSVAHDLRAPLRSIDGFCHRLVERLGPGLEPDTRSYLEKVSSASRRMARLVEGLLQFSLLSRADPRREEVDLSAIAIRAGQELARSQPDRRVLFLIEPGLRARGDPTLLGVMLWNLLENGFKFTAGRPEGRVEFGACPGKGPRTLFVRDDGVGFDMAHAPKLFKPFQRLHGRDEFPGSGIGLEMVQRIVDRHGGRVWAEARTGVGATFYFTLPGEP